MRTFKKLFLIFTSFTLLNLQFATVTVTKHQFKIYAPKISLGIQSASAQTMDFGGQKSGAVTRERLINLVVMLGIAVVSAGLLLNCKILATWPVDVYLAAFAGAAFVYSEISAWNKYQDIDFPTVAVDIQNPSDAQREQLQKLRAAYSEVKEIAESKRGKQNIAAMAWDGAVIKAGLSWYLIVNAEKSCTKAIGKANKKNIDAAIKIAQAGCDATPVGAVACAQLVPCQSAKAANTAWDNATKYLNEDSRRLGKDFNFCTKYKYQSEAISKSSNVIKSCLAASGTHQLAALACMMSEKSVEKNCIDCGKVEPVSLLSKIISFLGMDGKSASISARI